MFNKPYILTAIVFLIFCCGYILFALNKSIFSSTSIQTTDQSAMQNETIIINHGNKEATHAIIWLHGLGATSSDFPPTIPHLGLSKDLNIRFVFPQAPNRPITINNGMSMPGWYDIKGMTLNEKEDLEGMQESRSTLENLIEEQIALGIPSKNIIIAGFSQGGAVAYYTGIRSKHKLAGILAMSTYLPFAQQASEEMEKINLQTAVFSMHGDNDPVVPITMGKTSFEKMQALGFDANWQTYPMEHNVSLEQLRDIGVWINQHLH